MICNAGTLCDLAIVAATFSQKPTKPVGMSKDVIHGDDFRNVFLRSQEHIPCGQEYRDGMEKMPPEVIIGRNVYALRKARDWSQRDLAKRAGFDQKTISNLEAPIKGREAPSPTLHTLEAVAGALGVRIWQLLCPHEQCLAADPIMLEDMTEKFAAVSEPTRIYIKSVLQRETAR